MALQQVGSFWTYLKRPCVVEGHGSKQLPADRSRGRYAVSSWRFNRVRFLDGNQPVTAEPAESTFIRLARPILGQQAKHFARIWELNRQGVMMLQAVRQAQAELAKGIGQNDIVDAAADRG